MVVFDIYRAIRTALEASTIIEHIGWYNDQINNEELETAYNHPAVFIEFPDNAWEQQMHSTFGNTGAQANGYIQINVHVEFTLLNDISDEVDYMESIVEEVYYRLVGLSGTNFTTFKRFADGGTPTASRVYEWVLKFSTTGIEEGKDLGAIDVTEGDTNPIDLVLNTDLDIDNQIIRTGDGNYI